jgi:hypothetical protein
MKEQPVEIRENPVESAIGQRPIHVTYEPPAPLPQFRARPKLGQPQPAPKRRPPASTAAKLAQNTSIEVPAESETTDAKKGS